MAQKGRQRAETLLGLLKMLWGWLECLTEIVGTEKRYGCLCFLSCGSSKSTSSHSSAADRKIQCRVYNNFVSAGFNWCISLRTLERETTSVRCIWLCVNLLVHRVTVTKSYLHAANVVMRPAVIAIGVFSQSLPSTMAIDQIGYFVRGLFQMTGNGL